MIVADRLAVCSNSCPDPFKQFFESVAVVQLFGYHFVDNCREAERIEVGNICAFSGNDEFPARRNNIVEGIFLRISELYKAVNDYIVIAILRKAEPFFRKIGSGFKQFKGRVFVDSQVDLRVDEG